MNAYVFTLSGEDMDNVILANSMEQADKKLKKFLKTDEGQGGNEYDEIELFEVNLIK